MQSLQLQQKHTYSLKVDTKKIIGGIKALKSLEIWT